MKFNRRLKPFSALTFDLDDTLYANRQVMVATEQAMVRYFAELLAPYSSAGLVFNRHFWWPFRQQTIANNALLAHDVTALRRETYQLGIYSLTHDKSLSLALAIQAQDYFIKERSNFKVPDSVHELLDTLAKRYPLVAISNGNVDTGAIGLTSYFQHFLHAGGDNLKKPDNDMFVKAASLLNIPLSQLLHVGDCGHADVKGALRAGMQSVWLSCYDVGKPVQVLPHVEITNIAQIERLI